MLPERNTQRLNPAWRENALIGEVDQLRKRSVILNFFSFLEIPGITERNLEEFKVHIEERGSKYAEKIAIDEKNDLEFFHVPAHNGLAEADYLYDFKSVSVKYVLNQSLRP